MTSRLGAVHILRPSAPAGPRVRLGRRSLRSLLPVVLVAVLVGPVAVLMVLDGGLTAAFGATLLLLVALGGYLLASRALLIPHGRIEVRTGHRRLELPRAPFVTVFPLLASGLVLAFAAVLVALTVADADFLTRRASNPGTWVVLAVAGVAGLVSSPPPGQATRIVLSPDGVGQHRRRRTDLIAWDDLRPTVLLTDPAVVLHLGRRSDPEHTLTLPLALHRSDPALVHALVEHYRRNPWHRAELGTEAAVDRIRRGGPVAPR